MRGLGVGLRRFVAHGGAVFAILLLAAGSACGQQLSPQAQDQVFDEAVAALKRGDYVLAAESFAPLAERGHLAAQYDLGWMRAKGLGGPVDLVAAYQWFALVAKAGQEKGIAALAGVRGRMSPTQIAEAERRVRLWEPR